MMRMLPAPILGVVALSLIAGCKAPRDDGYPSLLPRPIEKRGFADPAPRPEPVATPDVALDGEVARAKAALRKAGAAFAGKAGEAERLAARAKGAAAGSEPWIAAQVALAELDTLRGGTAGALADIEKLAIDRAAAGKPPYPSLETLLADARAQNQREVERVSQIEGSMPRG
jgi:hypothetical protein